MSPSLDGAVALLTGGGHPCIGGAARIMAEQGATVILADRSEQRIRATADAINAGGGIAFASVYDPAQTESVRLLVASTERQYGRLDVLVNHVGGPGARREPPIVEIGESDWLDIFTQTVHTTHWATAAALGIMVERHRGAIVNVFAEELPAELLTQVGYGSARSAVAAYSRMVALQYGPRGIRCNSVSPGIICTSGPDDEVSPGSAETAAALLAPDGVARAIAWLASDSGGYVNGQEIRVAGAPRAGEDQHSVGRDVHASELTPPHPWRRGGHRRWAPGRRRS